MAADSTDEPGVLGNLPRSRPGHRSDKRGGVRAAATATAADAAKGSAGNVKRASARTTPARAKTTAPRKRATAPRARATSRPERAKPTSAPEPQPSSDPLSSAVRLAGQVAEAGLKTAGSLLRRLPGR